MATTPREVAGISAGDRAELDDLRRRAYGPGGGLGVAAADRLRTLEERAWDRAPDAVGSGDPATPPRDDGPREPSAQDASEPADLGLSGRSIVRRHHPLRHPLLVTLAALVTGALLVALGFALAQPHETVDAGSLDPVPIDQQEAEVVVGTASFSVRELDPDSLVQYESLGQGTPWSATRPDGGRCLILTVTDDSPEMVAAAGIWDVSCAPPGLAPIIDWTVDSSYPSPPQALPERSVVRLTLDDERVRLSIGRSG